MIKNYQPMKNLIFILSLLFSSIVFGQNTEIEKLVNQIARDEVPEDFKYYFLVPKSLEQEKIKDSLPNYQIRALKLLNKNLEESFLYEKPKNETVDWRNFNLKNATYVSDDRQYNQVLAPPQTKTIRYVTYNIDQRVYDSLNNNKDPYTLIVRKKWLWRKNRIYSNFKRYTEFVQNWKLDDQNNPEETVYFHFSKPRFSEDGTFAIVTVFKNRRCNGNGFSALYRKENEVWIKILEFNQVSSQTVSSHIRCEELRIPVFN